MGDGDHLGDLPTHTQEKVTVKIGTCFGLHGLKGSHLVSIIRVEYGTTLLGESPKVEADGAQATTDYNYSCQLNISSNDSLALDEIAQNPIVLTFIEILPKDKKAREEKTHILGQACIDLLPLLKGETNFTASQPIFPTSVVSNAGPTDTPNGLPNVLPSTNPACVGWASWQLGSKHYGLVQGSLLFPNEGNVDVIINASNVLLSQDVLAARPGFPLYALVLLLCSNMMTVCLESMYSVPESWSTNGSQYLYSAGLSIPINEQKEVSALLPNGIYKAAGEKNGTNQRKWSSAPTASGACLYIPNTSISKRAFEYEDGELKSKEDIPFRTEAENDKARITWNAERRCFINVGAAESLQYKIAQYRVWPIEVSRTAMPAIAKGKGKPEDETSMSYHGVAYVDFSPLLYPGVQTIRGAYPIIPFFESELASKTNRKPVLTEETSKMVGGIARSVASSMGMVKQQPAKLGKGDIKQKPSAAVLKPPDMTSEVESTDNKNAETQQYLESRTYIVLEIALEKPLVPKRQPEALAQRVAELIPARAKFPKKIGGAKKAIDDFQAQISRTSAHLLEEFRSMFGKDLESLDEGRSEERRKQFLYELNSSGKYFAFKEQIKYYIIKLVREKFMNTTGFQSQEEMQAFISELYQFLIDQMHTGLNKYLDSEETTEIPPPVTDLAMLKHFAKEAEAEFNFEVAARYYQERIARNKNEADNWLDYGIFCLLIDDLSKAEECIKETVAIDQKHVVGLILNGCIAMMQDEQETAEVLFEAATAARDDSVLAWTLLGLYYAGVENNIMSERAFNEAERLNGVQSGDIFCQRKSYVHLKREESLDNDNLSNIEEQPALEEADSGGTNGVSDNKSNEEHDRSQSVASNSAAAGATPLEKKPAEADNGAVGSFRDAHTANRTSIYLQAAQFLLDCHILQMAERSLALELLVSCGEHSSSYYELLARFKMEQKQYDAAKAAIEKALAIKHENADAWATMGHIHFLGGDYQHAKWCFERTLSYVDDPANTHLIYLRLAKIYWLDQQFIQAKHTYLKACKAAPSCITWLGVGKAAYKLDDLFDAEHALKEANVLDNKNAEAWAYLTLVCLKSARHLEAEQAYKYALKAGMEDEALLSEIHQTMGTVRFDTTVL